MPYYCLICEEEITEKVYNYSKSCFNRPLCRKHQDIAKLAAERLANEQKSLPKEPEPKINPIVVTKPLERSPMPPIDFGKSATKELNEDTLLQWLKQWVIDKSINLTMESKQFFLSGPELEELARDVIGKAQDEILVTSPYVDSCHLATTLQRAVERRVKVKVVARRPENTKNDVPKAEYQANLRKEGVIIHYNNQIHSKIIIIDRKITIISSMNLYSGSTGGATLEAGIVSFDKTVVDSAVKYIVELLEKPESSDPTATKTTTYWKNRRY
jgi:phosphatidylserine/phosphatidylglycerophosphate/cardiolipin synthase-like enzyme